MGLDAEAKLNCGEADEIPVVVFFFPNFTSTKVFHSPHAGHFPIHFGVSYPHEEQMYAVFSFAIILYNERMI